MSFSTFPTATNEEEAAYAASMAQYYAYIAFLAQAGHQQPPLAMYPQAALPFANQFVVGAPSPIYPPGSIRMFLIVWLRATSLLPS